MLFGDSKLIVSNVEIISHKSWLCWVCDEIHLWRRSLYLKLPFQYFLCETCSCVGDLLLLAVQQHVTKKEPSSWHCYVVHCYATTCEPPSCIRSLPRSGDFKCANSKVERPRWQTASCEKVETRIRRGKGGGQEESGEDGDQEVWQNLLEKLPSLSLPCKIRWVNWIF